MPGHHDPYSDKRTTGKNMDHKSTLLLLLAACLMAGPAAAAPWDGPRVMHDGADPDRVLALHASPGEFTVTWAPGPSDGWIEGEPAVAGPEHLVAGRFELERIDALGAPRFRTDRYLLVGVEADPGEVARALITRADVALAAPLFRLAPGGPWRAATPKILLQLTDPFAEAELYEQAERLGLQVDRRRGLAPDQWRLIVPPGATVDPAEAAAALHEDPITRWAQVSWLNQRAERFVPSESLYPDQWHLDNTGQGGGIAGHDMNAPEAWDITTGSAEVIIAILDSGVDMDHPDLQEHLVGGWDFVNDDSDPNPGGSSHGTGCAGTAAAPAQGTGVVGVCPDCLIMPIRMLGVDDESEADASDWAVSHGAWIINNSWGPTDGTGTYTPISAAMATSVDYAVNNGRDGLGVAIFWAGGNGHPNDTCDQDGFVAYPSTLAVGASSNMGMRSTYSELCDELDFSAPSSGGSNGTENITTTNIGGYTSSFGGTSAASPNAAGVGGLILSALPDLTWMGLREVLRKTATKIDPGGDEAADYDASGHSVRYGYGRVDAQEALSEELSFLTIGQALATCDDVLDVIVQWASSPGLGTVQVEADSGAETGELFDLTEDTPGTYSGMIPLTTAAASADDGLLSVLDGDVVVVSSLDLGDSGEVTIDCLAPQIIDERVEQVTHWGAMLAWETSEIADSFASWGPDPASSMEDPTHELVHRVWALNLAPCTAYTATIASTDVQGNSAELVDGLHWVTAGDLSVLPDDADSNADPCDESTWYGDDDDDDDDGRGPGGGMSGSGGACDCKGSLAGSPGGLWGLALLALFVRRRRRGPFISAA
jgi:MYXO-CTERM domain-containing protein